MDLWRLFKLNLHKLMERREQPHYRTLTLSITMAPVREGQIMPGMVPTVLEIPIRMAAYLGATSRWFTPKPAQVRPPRPRARERKVVEVPRVMIRSVSVMKRA